MKFFEKLDFERIGHNEGHFSYEHNSKNCLISISELDFENPMDAKFYSERIQNCFNACATLKNPVEDIRELVLAARDCVDIPISEEDEFRLLRLEQSLSKFEGVK